MCADRLNTLTTAKEKNMDNITQLFVRACKSGNPEQRIYSVYKRFYNRLEMPDQRKAAVADRYPVFYCRRVLSYESQ